MRQIAFDTETTGLNPESDRIVEIGCVELRNYLPTGEVFHCYINPQQPMDPRAAKVHGLTDGFLEDKPIFAEIIGDFLDFIGQDQLVIHNASFDMGMLNAELARLGMKPLPMRQAVDTVAIARQKFPGSPANLDALCRRFEVDASARTVHGALLDANLLAEVYLHLMGGRQHGLTLIAGGLAQGGDGDSDRSAAKSRPVRPPRRHQASAEELAAHHALLDKLTDPIWRNAD